LPTDKQGDGLVDDLVHEVTDNEPTDQALPEKLSCPEQYFSFGIKRAGISRLAGIVGDSNLGKIVKN
jgi:hypothetical protein